MPAASIGILSGVEIPLETRTVIESENRELYVNELPLWSRLPHKRGEGEVYTIKRRGVRGGINRRMYAVGTGGITNVATSLPIADATEFQVGDVLEMTKADGSASERVEVTANPVTTTTPNTLTVRRAREGTTGVAFAAADTIRLIGNARTGSEIDQQGNRSAATSIQQVIQTFQFPVQIGRKVLAQQNIISGPGFAGLMGEDRAIKYDEMVRDIEHTFYYGIGEVPAAAGDRGKMKGLKALIASYNSGSNVKTGSVLTSYTRSQFITDTIAKIFEAGGSPDTILCSADFMGFIDTWAPGKTTQMDVGSTSLGVPIETFSVPLNGRPLDFIVSLQLRPGTAFVLTASDLEIRHLDEAMWNPRGVRGDAYEGDWVGDYCIHVSNPHWHAFVDGISTVAA